MGKEKLAPAVKVEAEQICNIIVLRPYNYHQGSILIPLTAKFLRKLYIMTDSRSRQSTPLQK